MSRVLLILLLGLSLTGCFGAADPGPGLPALLEQFTEAMRWKDYQGAARHLQPEVQGSFLELFREDEDLMVVDSRILRVDLHGKEGWAEAEYQLEYYYLPSSRIKKWLWTQRWKQAENITKPGIWLIENAPPAVPWKP